MHHNFKKSTSGLIKKYIKSQENSKLIEFQLNLAKRIQHSFIPPEYLKINNIEFHSKYIPALYIGGDIYDIIKIDENYIGILLGDVCGHGISASLLTATLKYIFRNLINISSIPNELLTLMNIEFKKIFNIENSILYASTFYIRINTKNYLLEYCNAGHTYPLLVKSNSILELESSGFPLGLVEDTQYVNNKICYDKNDLLFLYTDGLHNNLYKENICEFTNELKGLIFGVQDNPCPEIVSLILENFSSDCNNLKNNDDVSVILCKL